MSVSLAIWLLFSLIMSSQAYRCSPGYHYYYYYNETAYQAWLANTSSALCENYSSL
jgi:hypothetical protein